MFKKIELLLSIVFIGVLIFFSISVSQTKAGGETYIVKPYLVIPKEYNTEEIRAKIPHFEENISQALEEAQSWYAKTLNGKTFNLEKNIEVILDQNSAPLPKLGEIIIEWVVGLKLKEKPGFYAWANPSLPGKWGTAIMPYTALLDLDSPGDNRNFSIKATIHELGHTFGLVFAGWANEHPCTEISPKECTYSAPQPYAPEDEWTNSVMGTGPRDLSTAGLNNSSFNPEIWKIYKSPFINPNKSLPPPTTIHIPPIKNPTIISFEPQPVQVGQTLAIKGINFEVRNQQVIFFDDSGQTNGEIISWADNIIEVKVPEKALGKKWVSVIIYPPGEERLYSTKGIQIMPEDPPIFLSIEISTSCGEDKKPLAEVPITFLSNINITGGTIKTETDGNALLTLQIQRSQSLPITYVLTAKSINGVAPEQSSVRIDLADEEDLNREVNFHYIQCPGEDIEETPLPSPSLSPKPPFVPPGSSPSPSSEEEYPTPPLPSKPPFIPLPPQGQPEQVIISNYEDFRENNAPLDSGSETLVIENPQEQEEVQWEDSTLSQNQPTYIREVYQDGTVKDYSADLDEGEETQVGNVKIEEVEPQKVKTVKRISIGDEVIWPEEEGSKPVKLSLRDQTVFLIEVEYSDGPPPRHFSLTFKKPASAVESPLPIPPRQPAVEQPEPQQPEQSIQPPPPPPQPQCPSGCQRSDDGLCWRGPVGKVDDECPGGYQDEDDPNTGCWGICQ